MSRVDPAAEPNREDVEAVANLGSYVAQYVGTYGEELFERPIEQLTFYALTWGAPTRRVDFSNGAEEYIDAELGASETDDSEPMQAGWQPDVDAEDVERAAKADDEKVSDLLDGDGCDLESIGVVDADGEETYEAKLSGVDYVQIADASHLDPPKVNPPDVPKPGYDMPRLTGLDK